MATKPTPAAKAQETPQEAAGATNANPAGQSPAAADEASQKRPREKKTSPMPRPPAIKNVEGQRRMQVIAKYGNLRERPGIEAVSTMNVPPIVGTYKATVLDWLDTQP